MVRHICLGDSLDQAADRWNGRIGWIFDSQRISFREMRTRTDEVARALLASGIGKGDVVAIWTSNRPEYVYCLMACAKIGAILTAINTRSRSFEVEHTLEHSRARILFRLDGFLKMDFKEILGSVCSSGDIGPEGVVASRKFSQLQLIVSLSQADTGDAVPWAEFLARASAVSQAELLAIQKKQECRDPVILQYTSGTTARPKGALLNHLYACNFGVDTVRRLHVQEGEALLNTQPFYHTGGGLGGVCVPLTIGNCTVIPEFYEAERVLALIEREKCVARTGFGAMYLMEMEHPNFRKYDLSSIRAAWCLAPPEVMQRVQAEMKIPAVLQLYGSTEGGGTAGDIRDSPHHRIHSCGRPVDGVEIGVRDPESGQTLPAGSAGEIVTRGWWQMNEYLGQPDATRAVLDPDGWVRTGDRGYLDEQGYLFLLGRIKNMMKVGGENVSAEEVEAMLLQHPKVKVVLAVGVPDKRLNEVVMAIVELKKHCDATPDELIAFCAQRMANFRVPRHIRFVDEWPLTGSGKIERHTVRQQFVDTVTA